jgi:hypothetical protein
MGRTSLPALHFDLLSKTIPPAEARYGLTLKSEADSADFVPCESTT